MSNLFMNLQQRQFNKNITKNLAKNFINNYNINSSSSSYEALNSNTKFRQQISNGHITNGHTREDKDIAEVAEVTVSDAESDANAEFDENILSLKLKKPKHWKWELTTSRSCNNIAIPRIMLYDYKGQLLIDANSHTEQIYKQNDQQKQQLQQRQRHQLTSARKRTKKAATANLATSIRQALDREFNDLQIKEVAMPARTSTQTRAAMPLCYQASNELSNGSISSHSQIIDYYTHKLPDLTTTPTTTIATDSRTSSLKGVRFNVAQSVDNLKDIVIDSLSCHVINLPTPPSTTTTTTTTNTTSTSNSSGPREKKRYRRSRSSSTRSPTRSTSILERSSFNRGRFSSPEYADEHDVYKAPRYFLRSSKVGTLVVKEESFSHCRRRRKTKNSSNENNSKNSLKTSPPNSMINSNCEYTNKKQPKSASSQSAMDNIEMKRKIFNLRKQHSEVDINKRQQQQQQLSTSEEEEHQINGSCALNREREKRKYTNSKRRSKKDLVIIDTDNIVQHTNRQEFTTAS